jgi:hypothetical protein
MSAPVSLKPGQRIDSRRHAGFDYAAAIEELEPYLGLEKIAYYMGYANPTASCVQKFKKGVSVPSHDKGEMLWAVYCLVFERKPPCSESQVAGLEDDAFLESVRDNVKKSAPSLPPVR